MVAFLSPSVETRIRDGSCTASRRASRFRRSMAAAIAVITTHLEETLSSRSLPPMFPSNSFDRRRERLFGNISEEFENPGEDRERERERDLKICQKANVTSVCNIGPRQMKSRDPPLP